MASIAAVNLVDTLERADQNITLAINSLHCEFTDQIWLFFSNKYVWIPLYLAVLAFFFIRLGWRKAIVATLVCILTVVICDQVGNLFKDYFCRFRPCWDTYMTSHESFRLLEGQSGYYGFYSAHAANSMGFAICSYLCFKQHDTRFSYKAYKWGIVSWAVLVGLSRIFVGKHFCGDVIVGLAVGLLVGFAMAELARKLILNHKRKAH